MAENTIGSAYVQIIPSSEGIAGSISSVLDGEAASAGESAGKTLGGSLAGNLTSALAGAGKVAAGAVAAATTAVTGLASGIMSAAGATAEYGDSIDKMSQKLGMSAEGYQEWDFILQHSGTSVAALKPAMKTLTKELESGSEAFEALGLSTKELEGLDKEAQFNKVVAGLQSVEDEAERSRLATELFGRGAMELGPLLNTSAEDTEAMRKQVHDLGGVLSDEAVKNSAAFQDSLQNLQYAMQGVTNSAMAEFLPSITTIMDGMSAALSGDENGINMVADGLMSMFESAGEILPDLIDKGTQLITQIVQGISENADAIGEGAAQIILTLGQALIEIAPTLLDAAISIAGSLLEGIASGITGGEGDIATAGSGIIDFIVSGLTEGLPNLISQGAELINQFSANLQENLPGILETGTELIMQLVNGLAAGLPNWIQSAGDLVNSLLNAILTNAPALLQSGVELIVQIGQGIAQNLPAIAASAVEVVGQLLTTLMEHLPEILQSGLEMVGQLAAGLIQALPDIIAAAVTLTSGLISKVLEVDWIGLGVDIINGIIEGLKSMAEAVATALLNIIKAGIDSIKKFLGIKSPSKLMNEQVGQMMALGVAEGIESAAGDVDKAMQSLASDAVASIDVGTIMSQQKGRESVNSENGMLARLDMIIAIMAEYYPEVLDKIGTESYMSTDMIDRRLGMAVN